MTKTIKHIATSILPLLEGRLRGGELRSGWRVGVRLMSWGWVFGVLLTLFLTTGTQGALAETVVGQVFYEQNYEATGVAADWTTSVNGRYTPTKLEDGDNNHYLSVVQTERNNNGCVLTNTSLNGKVIAGTDFVMTFDLKVSSSNNQSPTTFTINDAANTGTIFSLTATGTNATTWELNGGTTYTLPNTNKNGGGESIADVPWYSVKIKRISTITYVTITPKAGGEAIVSNASVTASGTGGLGNMTFETKRYNANFAIDNIHVTSLFSYASESGAIDITSIGMANRLNLTTLMPELVNEISGSVTETTYSSSDFNVAKPEIDGVYLTGIGTTSIGIKKRINGDDYKSNYELTVYGSQATVTKTVTDNAGTTEATWFVNDNAGLIEQSYDFGVVTLTTSYGTETPISVNDGSNHYVVRVIRSDNTLPGSTTTNTDGSTLHEDNSGGTFFRIDLAQRGALQIWGTGGQSAILLNALTTSSTIAANTTDTGTGSSTWNNLSAGTYYLYNTSLHRITYTYTTPKIAWSDNTATANIMDVGITNPNTVTGLPTLTKGNGDVKTTQTGTDGAGVEWHNGYGSSNPSVAIFQGDGSVLLKSTGTTIMKVLYKDGVIDGSGNVNDEANIAAYKLVVTGNTVTHTISNGNTMLSFDDEGVIGTGQQTAALTNLTVTYGYTGENSIVTEYNGMKLLKVIDANGYSHPNLTGNGEGGQPPSTIPWEGAAGGTFIKLNATANGYLVVTGNVSADVTRIYKWGTTTTTPVLLTPEFNEEKHTMSVTLGTNETGDNYYLYNTRPAPDDGTYVPPVHAISFVPGFFTNAYETVRREDIASYTLQTVKGFESPTYTIVETAGDVYDGVHAIGIDGSNHLTNVAGGGAIRIRATKDAKTLDYILTVAYPADKLWNFNDGSSIHSITAVPRPTTPSGDWTARYKNATRERDARWFYQNAVAGDNAFIVEKTAGLIFETAANSFYMRNDDNTWRHIGFARRGASFTIPLLKAGDIVELNWKRDADNSGANFTATNVTDLRGKTVSETFNITGSRSRDRGDRYTDEGGWTSFIVAADGDVKFTLDDNGYNDLLSVRIYNGGYRPTMDPINQYDGGNGVPAPTSILLDNALQSVTLNYSNPLHGTATGPAMYVLKGYRSGTDNIENVTGEDSQKPSNTHIDEEGYPTTTTEQAELYAQRQYLKDFHMYNQSWTSANNTYNNGVIEATGGYGKVTVRLNNYTNDMKYVIGYTPDYTVTFGSAPHQTYPYTWNFTNISGGAVKDKSDNAYNNVSTDYNTWANLGNCRFGLYTDTGNGSYYVPGATLVAKGRELNRDEFAGLGFAGGLYFQTADGTADTEPTISAGYGNLLSFTMDTFKDVVDFDNNLTTDIAAGNGYVCFGGKSKLETETGIGRGKSYRMDGNVSATGSKYALLKPKRALRNGDIITFKAYSKMAVNGSDYGLSLYPSRNTTTALATLYIPSVTPINTEVTLTHTVTKGDGLAGLAEVYVFRALGKTTYLTEMYITAPAENLGEGVNYGKCITASSSEPLVITIPDLNAGGKQDYIYIESSAAPSDITNATAAVAADGLDAKPESDIYKCNKYKVTEPGNCEVTFDGGTKIYRIGVTHIMKQLTTIGEGGAAKGWATESRNCAIDYNLTGVFTLNDVKAKYATVDYDVQKAIVTLKNIGNYGVPASTGLVLKMEDVSNLTKANSSGVPLFAPAISTTTLTAANIAFNGPMGNAMQPNVTSRIFETERENADGTDNASGTFTRFILATRFMKWKKIGDAAVTHDATFTEGNVPVFYRMHLYNSEEADALSTTVATLNTLGANKAYLSLHTANLPDALWKSSGGGGGAKPFIPIFGESDMEEMIEGNDGNNGNDGNHVNNGTYTLSGQRVNDNSNLPPGIYIRNGKKVVVK